MYIPKHNTETRVPVMHGLIQAQPFGTLVTMTSAGLFATHLPMVLEMDGSELGVLKGHVARANAQWREFDASVEALAIFAGDHHYISSSWYPLVSGVGAEKTGAEVPTWNYVVVHAYGTLRVIDDPALLLAHLTSLTNIHEAASAEAWSVDAAPDGYIEQQMRGIVGLELPIRRLEGKWKVSQNRNERDRKAVIKGLNDLDTPESLAMKELVERAGLNQEQ
jgi:transcriptional regulator